jgi:hypothetical protein
MQICPKHWEALKKAIADRGMAHLGHQTAERMMIATVNELEGREAENDFDPLLACNNMIFTKGLEVNGLALMAMNEDGTHRCPVCMSLQSYEAWWIEGPANSMLEDAREKGLMPKEEASGEKQVPASADDQPPVQAAGRDDQQRGGPEVRERLEGDLPQQPGE